jgi:O-antigen/teichoic acid export membrane protein
MALVFNKLKALLKSTTSNFLGTIFDKLLVLIVGLYISNFITADDYGYWVIFYQFILISFTSSFSPNLEIYSRKSSQYISNGLPVFNLKSSIIITVIIGLVYSYSLNLNFFYIFAVPIFALYQYVVLHLRFQGEDRKYALLSFLRLIIFLGVSILYHNIYLLDFFSLVSIFLAANLIVIIPFLGKLFVEKGHEVESLSLTFYGFVSSIGTSSDKLLILALALPVSKVGYYSYLLLFSSLPNIAIEALKKTVYPGLYRNLETVSKSPSDMLKDYRYIILINFVLFITIPCSLYFVMFELDLLNKEFVFDINYIYILMLSLASFIWSCYHFVSPLYISDGAAMRLASYQLFGMVIAVVVGVTILSIETWFVYRAIFVVSVLSLSVFGFNVKRVR